MLAGKEKERYFNQFVSNEFFDLTLYKSLLKIEEDELLRKTLSELIETEKNI